MCGEDVLVENHRHLFLGVFELFLELVEVLRDVVRVILELFFLEFFEYINVC